MEFKTGDLVSTQQGEDIGLVMWTQRCMLDGGFEADMCFVLWPGNDRTVMQDPLGLTLVSEE